MFKAGDTGRTRDGRRYSVVSEYPEAKSIVVKVRRSKYVYSDNGRVYINGPEHPLDLLPPSRSE